MTINTTSITSGPYAGNGVANTFNYGFTVKTKNQLSVAETDSAGAETILTVDTHYTVNNVGTDGGGDITRIAGALPTGSTWYIRSNYLNTQDTSFNSQGAFFPEVHESQFDHITFLVQQLVDLNARTFRISETDADVSSITALPAAATRANRVMAFDENGDLTVSEIIGDWKGTWTTSTLFSKRDIYQDPATTSIYFVVTDHTSTSVAADVASGVVELVIDGSGAASASASAAAALSSANAASTSAGLTAADLLATNADVSTTNTNVGLTAADLLATNADVTYTKEWANNAEDLLVSAAATGDQVDDFSALHHAAKAAASAVASAANATTYVSARNTVLNQDPVSQGVSTRTGMSSTIYTGTGAAQSIATGVDMSTGDLGGLVWVKERSSTSSHQLADTVRGSGRYANSDLTASETADAQAVTSFDTTGFSVGTNTGINENTQTCVAWSLQTNQKIIPTGTGSELVTNGAFDTDTTGWVNGDAASTISVSSQQLKVLGSDTTPALSTQTLTAIVGKTYLVKVDVDTSNNGNNSARILIDGVDKNNTANPNSVITSFTATTTSPVLILSNGVSGSVSGDFNLWDNVTVKEIGTTSLGITNRGKPYTAHYNADMGFSIVGYEGDGAAGHEIPHHLGTPVDLRITKNRDSVSNWIVTSPLLGVEEYLELDVTSAVFTNGTFDLSHTDSTVSTVNAFTALNELDADIISYHFASVPGVSKIGKYIGTGAAGNYVDCGFKPAFVMIKNLTDTGTWAIFDSIRGAGELLQPNESAAELSGTSPDFTEEGFVHLTAGTTANDLNDEFIFLAFAETGTDATKAFTDYSYATTQDVLTINPNTIISHANGFASGSQVDINETVGAGVTVVLGAGFEDKHLWLYKTAAGGYATTEFRPLEGTSRVQADKWGEVSRSDSTLRTTAKHFDYESETGVVSASSEFNTTLVAYNVFNKDANALQDRWAAVSLPAQLQYKQTEKRILKSWRLRQFTDAERPTRFTIEGSSNGSSWVAIDSTYTASDYTGNGSNLWGDLQSTAANVTAYLYHRINITATVSSPTPSIQELEFNTVLPSDFYDVIAGKMFDSTDVEIQRTYLAELRTNTDGEVSNFTNFPVAKAKGTDTEYQGNLTVHGDLVNPAVVSAWVNFDGLVNPPLIRSSFGIAAVVDLGTGSYRLIPEDGLDFSTCAVTGMATVNSTSVGAILSLRSSTPLGSRFIDIYIETDASVAVDSAICTVIIAGAKVGVL